MIYKLQFKSLYSSSLLLGLQVLLDLLPVLNSVWFLVTIWPSIVDPCNILVSGIMAKPALGGITFHVGLHNYMREAMSNLYYRTAGFFLGGEGGIGKYSPVTGSVVDKNNLTAIFFRSTV